ncbi:MAG TPA: metallophosphoesterase [Blastocatellia bacterium]|nr:metallophosphoesterase [Blastocatellia bacterium]
MKRIVAAIGVITILLLSSAGRVQSQQAASSAVKPGASVSASNLTLPNKSDSVHFAVIGDTGTGSSQQRELGELMSQYHSVFPFDCVLMMGDNIYGGEAAKDYEAKFAQPYKELLDAGVKFHAALGNHDNSNQPSYKNFNMEGKEYYTFKKGGVRFFALNSNYMDERQLKWLESELKNSGADWKICFFHHPPYSSGEKHGPSTELRKIIEPLFIKYGVDVVFTGHEHFYERIKPQNGVYYFISGAGGQLRLGGVKPTDLTAKSFDKDQHFMLIEIAGNQMYFQAISRAGKTIDSGALSRLNDKKS